MTHPFHPWYGRKFQLVTSRLNWGKQRVYFFDDQGVLASLPAAWTSVAARDAFVEVSAGRSAFRIADLVELSRLAHLVARGEAS